MAVDSTVQFKRGKKNDLPYGLEGEPLYCIDTNELYVGQGKDLPPKLINANGTGGGSGGTEIDDNSTGITTTWSASKINQMFEDLKYTPIKINSFRANLSTFVYEVGTVLSNIVFNWSLSRKATNIILTDCNVQPTDDTATFTGTLNVTKTFTLKVTDAKNATATASVTIYFVSPIYYGTFSDNLTESYILGQNKLVQTKGNKSVTLTYNDKKVFYAYPKAYGTLRDIKDGNGFSYINDFIKSEMTLKGVTYYVYTIKDKASATGITFTFSF